jgi:hypothetical protein
MKEALLCVGGVVPGHDHIGQLKAVLRLSAQLDNTITAARDLTAFTPIVITVRLQYKYKYSKGARVVPVIDKLRADYNLHSLHSLSLTYSRRARLTCRGIV